MKRTQNTVALIASLVLLLGSSATRAATITTDWLGAEVMITHPDSVVLGAAFDITFSVDASTLPASGTLAFKTFLDASDTIDVSNSTWEYIFSSDDPAWNLSFSGNLGDSITPFTHDASGYSVRLYDPVNGERTWIWADYDDRVTWTLHDIVLLDDTSLALTLDAYLTGPTTFDFAVTGAPVAVPALPAPALVAAAFFLVAAAAIDLRRRGPGAARDRRRRASCGTG